MNDSTELRILHAWLAEWSARQNLRPPVSLPREAAEFGGTGSLSAEAARAALRSAIRPYGTLPVPKGEVRLLSAALTPGVERPVYVAVLQEAGAWRLVVPFGPFSVPGTPDELLLEELDGAAEDALSGGLAVLEMREAVWVDSGQMEKSWTAGHLSPDALLEAEAVLLAHFNGAPLPAELSTRVGARVSPRGSDPRHAYLREEANLLAGVGGLQPVWIEESEAVKEVRALAFAAADSASGAETKLFLVPGKEVELKLVRGAGSDSVVVSVLGLDGELSGVLDGFSVCGIQGADIAGISGSVARVAVGQLAGAFGLRSPAGARVQVVRKV